MPASGNSDGNDETVEVKKHEAPPGRRRHPTKIQIPRRAPSVVTPPRQVVYPSPDRTTCKSCPCYPKEEPYFMPKKLNPCLKSPLTLYELAAKVVDNLEFPEAFGWSVDDVAVWMSEDVGLPRYMECIRDNNINGRRLLLLEDGSHCPEINIHDFEHIKQISRKIHELFSTEFIKFSRSIGLPPRKPLTHCTWFKSRTGPTWGIRQNWSRSDILRWMKILMPEPIYMNHWDLVWYHKPDFPCVKFARVPKPPSQVFIPHYKPEKEICREYLAQRKFKILHHIPEDLQYIWMERRPGDMKPKPKKVKKKKFTIPIPSRLDPKKIDLEGLSGKDLILARRRLPKRKFLDI